MRYRILACSAGGALTPEQVTADWIASPAGPSVLDAIVAPGERVV